MILRLKNALRSEGLSNVLVEVGGEWEVRVQIINNTSIIWIVKEDHMVVLQTQETWDKKQDPDLTHTLKIKRK